MRNTRLLDNTIVTQHGAAASGVTFIDTSDYLMVESPVLVSCSLPHLSLHISQGGLYSELSTLTVSDADTVIHTVTTHQEVCLCVDDDPRLWIPHRTIFQFRSGFIYIVNYRDRDSFLTIADVINNYDIPGNSPLCTQPLVQDRR